MSDVLKKTEEFTALYNRAFQDFGTRALWNVRRLANPTPEEALAITRQLRAEGNLPARRLAEQLERACHGAL